MGGKRLDEQNWIWNWVGGRWLRVVVGGIGIGLGSLFWGASCLLHISFFYCVSYLA